MSLPRAVYPGSINMVTRRCTQRQFLLRPDPQSTNAFIYCLAVAAERHNIDVLGFIQMSNHLHDQILDRDGNGPAFYEHFHKLLAKCMNALRGRWENFFSSEQVCVVRLDSREAILDKLVYIITNPVKDGLVARVDEWPGASGYQALLDGTPIKATRPTHFFAEDGTMPTEVELTLTLPPEVGDRATFLAELQARVTAVEEEQARIRTKTGRRPLGRYAVQRQSWRESPTSREPRRGLRPTFVARSLWALIEKAQRKRAFVKAYQLAREALLVGTPIPFPHGTYWLKRFVNVEVDDSKMN